MCVGVDMGEAGFENMFAAFAAAAGAVRGLEIVARKVYGSVNGGTPDQRVIVELTRIGTILDERLPRRGE